MSEQEMHIRVPQVLSSTKDTVLVVSLDMVECVTSKRIAELEQRIEKAKALVGHKSLDSRRELLEILEGTENNP